MGTDVDMKLEIVVIPVSDVERAAQFYGSSGGGRTRTSGETASGVVQLTPPGSPCSVHFGKSVTSAPPERPSACTSSSPTSWRRARSWSPMESGRARSSTTPPAATTVSTRTRGRAGPIRERRSYASFLIFNDPDGNGWVLQEITTRFPGRIDSSTTSFASASGPGERDAPRGGRPRRAREAHRCGGPELARLVRRVHGRGAERQGASRVGRRGAGHRATASRPSIP